MGPFRFAAARESNGRAVGPPSERIALDEGNPEVTRSERDGERAVCVRHVRGTVDPDLRH